MCHLIWLGVSLFGKLIIRSFAYLFKEIFLFKRNNFLFQFVFASANNFSDSDQFFFTVCTFYWDYLLFHLNETCSNERLFANDLSDLDASYFSNKLLLFFLSRFQIQINKICPILFSTYRIFKFLHFPWLYSIFKFLYLPKSFNF